MKLVRVLVAAAATVVTAVALQLGSPSAGAAANIDCANCWPPGIVQR